MIRSRRSQAPSGFTLLEVLLALAIFVGSAAALSRLILLGIENAEYSQEQTEAMIIAEARWAEIEAGLLDPASAGAFNAPEFPEWQCALSANTQQTTGLYQIVLQLTKPAPPPAQGYSVRLTRLWFDEQTVTAAQSEATTTEASAP
jgi:type II secretion system protein I